MMFARIDHRSIDIPNRRNVRDRLPPVAALFPRPAERELCNHRLGEELACAAERVAAGSVTPTLDLEAFRTELAEFDFAGTRELPEVLRWIVAQMEHGLVHITHPRYFGLFNPAPTFPAQCADRIAAVFNPQLATSTTSPAAVAIESHVISAVARRVGLPDDAAGHFTSGGSEANYTALLCALSRSHPQFAASGARAFAGPPVFYVSRESHRAWLKIALQAGLGREAARLVATDGSGRMDCGALMRMLEADRRDGCFPVMIAATAGTTNAGMIDPLARCAQIARDADTWFHVDAAWGGAVVASEQRRGVLAGIEDADSVTIDAHKWLGATMGCGMFITRWPPVLASTFQVATGFMPSNLHNDPYVNSVQWSRRFLGLGLFLSLAVAGWPGYARHIERAIELSEMLGDELRARRWSVVNDSPLAVLCVEPPPGSADVRAIVTRVLQTGRAWVAAASYEGRDVVRVCVTHGETTVEDVDQLVESLTNAL